MDEFSAADKILLQRGIDVCDPQNTVLAYMRHNGIPQTRENYLALAFPTREPDAEELADIPDEFQDAE